MSEASNNRSDASAAITPRSRRLVPFILLAIVAGLAPAFTLLWVSRQRALNRSQSLLTNVVAAGVDRIDRILTEAEVTLAQLKEETEGEGGQVSDQTVERLQRAVYETRWFREAGIIDSEGRLVCTSLGLVVPPVAIEPAKRSRPDIDRMQIVGIVTTEIMREASLILSLPTRSDGQGAGEVNLLMDPAVLTEMFEQFPIGPGGFVEVVTNDGRSLARFGSVSDPATASAPAANAVAEQLLIRRSSDKFPVLLAAGIDREWALREWYADLKWMTPLAIAASAALAALVMGLGSRPASLRDDLRIALRRGEFEVHYQPLIDLDAGKGTPQCIGAEALIRWKHPREGYVRPNIFIGVAEDSGLIEPITEWLIDRVAKDLGEMLRQRADLHVGINLAPGHFNSRDIIETLQRILRPYQLPLERLTLEATERGMIGGDVGLSRDVMDALRSMGVRIALDDFGTGYSSLAYLHTFKFDAIKIDASFVRTIGLDSVSAGVIDAIIDLGHTLNVSIIAEGVEQQHQLEFLRKRGVHAAQGWLFAKAMPAAAFIEFVRKAAARTE